MIYTLTFSPALDLCMWADSLEPGLTNRSQKELINVGGKGINVSVVLNELGFKSTALGFVGGFVGDEIERRLKQMNITADFVHLNENSRINVKLMGTKETEINAKGPTIDSKALNLLFEKLNSLNSGDTLIISGSAPEGAIPKVLEAVADRGVLTVVDTSRKNLLDSLKYRPFFIKPNKQEVEELFNVTCGSLEDISKCADKLINMGAENVAVSLGKDGVLFKNKEAEVFVAAPKGEVINTVGSGDSLVAGFVAGYINKKDFEYAIKLGVACGSATAFSPALATAQRINEALDSMD
ncbi:MAG: 1-phosphofructokinase [Clostridia bacterium]|nr:1-phosphofructokinase [Clostridia bacterium]